MTSYIIRFTIEDYHIMVQHVLTIISGQHVSTRNNHTMGEKTLISKLKNVLKKQVSARGPLKIYVRRLEKACPKLRTTALH